MSKKPFDPCFDPEVTSSLKRTLCAAVLVRVEKTPAKGDSAITPITILTLAVLALLPGRPELMDVLGGGS